MADKHHTSKKNISICEGALMQNDCFIQMKHSSLQVKVPYSLDVKKKKIPQTDIFKANMDQM